MRKTSPARRSLLRLLLGVGAVNMTAALPLFLAGGLAVQIKQELGLSDSAFGAAFSGYFVLAAMASSPIGRTVQGRSPTMALRLSAVVAAATLVGVGLGARSWLLFAVVVALSGLPVAIAEPAGSAVVASAVRASRYGLALGVKQASFPTAGAISGLAVPALGVTLGWRWTMVSAAGLAVLALAAVPRDRRPPAPGKVLRARRGFEADLDHMILLSIAVGLGSLSSGAFTAFLVSSVVAAGATQSTGGLLLSLATATSIPLRIVVGNMLDRSGRSALRVAAALATAGAVGYALLATGREAFLPLGAVMAFAAGWGWIGVFHYAIVRLNPETPAAATGFTQTGTYVGAVIGPLAFGAVADRYGYGIGWLSVSICLLLAAAALIGTRFLIVRRLDRQPMVRPPSTTYEDPVT